MPLPLADSFMVAAFFLESEFSSLVNPPDEDDPPFLFLRDMAPLRFDAESRVVNWEDLDVILPADGMVGLNASDGIMPIADARTR